ncbi:helix-turn-helix domain-containing protein, partial [uncultured Helicobacter sp.]
MGQWVSSKEFAKAHSVKIDTLYKTIQRNSKCEKKICKIIGKFCPILYANGHIGGNAGKVLRIWSEPFKTQAEAEAFVESYIKAQEASFQKITTPTTLTTPHKIGTSSVLAQEQAKALSCPSHFIQSAQSKTMFDNKDDDGQLRALDAFSKASQKDKNLALEKKSIIKEWEAYKARGVNAKDFIALLNAGGQYSIALSENKLYAWQRAYKRGGLELLLDERGKNRKEQSKIKELGLEEL